MSRARPAFRADAAHKPRHVLLPVHLGNHGVQLDPDAAPPQFIGVIDRPANVVALAASKRRLHVFQPRVDRQPDPVHCIASVVEQAAVDQLDDMRSRFGQHLAVLAQGKEPGKVRVVVE